MKLPTIPVQSIKQNSESVLIWLRTKALSAFKTKALLAVNAVRDLQSQANKNTRTGLEKNAPIVLTLFDTLPGSVKRIAPLLPWLFLILFTLNLFNFFEKSPPTIKAQDQNIVLINPDIQKMISTGEASVGPYIEVIKVSGRIDFHESYLARIGANVTGRVSEMLAIPGQMVKQGDVLAQITSIELTQSQLAFLKARNTSDLAERAAERAKLLFKEDVIPLAEMQRRESEASNAKAEFRASQDQLIVQGMNKNSINRLAKTGNIESINNVTATLAGEVVERKINRGQVVQPSDALFTIANMDTLWAIAQVPETNAPLIKKGQKTQIQVSALNNKTTEANISFVSSIVNPETRTVVVRAEVDNTNRQLKPGMLASMLVESEPIETLTVPAEAIIRDGNSDYVFIKVSDEVFRMIPVKAGQEGKGIRPIYSGIEAGQVIAIKGAYHLNTERKRQLSGG